MVMRFKINRWAHKYLPEILCMLILIILVDIWFGSIQRTAIKSNTDKTLVNQETSLVNDSVSLKKIEKLEKTQDKLIDEAKGLRMIFRRK